MTGPSPGKSNSWVWKASLIYEEEKVYKYEPLITEAGVDYKATALCNKPGYFCLQVRAGFRLLSAGLVRRSERGIPALPAFQALVFVQLASVSGEDKAKEKQQRWACVNTAS